MKCPKCASKTFVKYGKARQKQRFKCKACAHQFTSENSRFHSLEEKLFALTLLASGLSMHAVANVLGVSVQSVMRWKNSGAGTSDKIIKALRIRKVSKMGKVRIIRENVAPKSPVIDDFGQGDVYSLETQLSSGVRVDIVVKRKSKTITK